MFAGNALYAGLRNGDEMQRTPRLLYPGACRIRTWHDCAARGAWSGYMVEIGYVRVTFAPRVRDGWLGCQMLWVPDARS